MQLVETLPYKGNEHLVRAADQPQGGAAGRVVAAVDKADNKRVVVRSAAGGPRPRIVWSSAPHVLSCTGADATGALAEPGVLRLLQQKGARVVE